MPPITTTLSSSGDKNAINPEWKNYYLLLEGIRQSGICNMFGAHPYLAELAGISLELAKNVLSNWIKNYDELKKLYWPDQRVYVNLKDIAED